MLIADDDKAAWGKRTVIVRLELTTSRLTAGRSNQLSYTTARTIRISIYERTTPCRLMEWDAERSHVCCIEHAYSMYPHHRRSLQAFNGLINAQKSTSAVVNSWISRTRIHLHPDQSSASMHAFFIYFGACKWLVLLQPLVHAGISETFEMRSSMIDIFELCADTIIANLRLINSISETLAQCESSEILILAKGMPAVTAHQI